MSNISLYQEFVPVRYREHARRTVRQTKLVLSHRATKGLLLLSLLANVIAISNNSRDVAAAPAPIEAVEPAVLPAVPELRLEITRHNLHNPLPDSSMEVQRLATKHQILWLARVIMSEDSDPYNQEIIAQVVRRRVEAGYKGNTYKQVILARLQFSAFNSKKTSARYTRLNWNTPGYKWRRALNIATKVYFLPEDQMEVPSGGLHFYALRSMVGGQPPAWARQGQPMDMHGLGSDHNRLQIILGAP